MATEALGKISKTASTAADSVASTLGFGKKETDLESGKYDEQQARIAAAAGATEENPVAQVAEKAKEYIGVASAWTEENIGPYVSEYAVKGKEFGGETIETLSSEGIFTKEAVVDSYEVSSKQLKVADGKFVTNTVLGEVPCIEYATCIEGVKIQPADLKAAFVFWNMVCLGFGYLDMAVFALVKFTGDAGRDLFLYLPMYLMKLAFDVLVCSAIAYALHFIFTKSASASIQLLGLGFIAFVCLKSLAAGFLLVNPLAFFEGVANALLLLRAFLLYKSAPPPEKKYTELKDEEKSPLDEVVQ